MQLLIILIMLLCGGNNNTFNEIKPLLQDVGGEDAAKAISQAEELNSVISAVQNLNGSENSDIASILNSFAGGIFGGDSNAPQQTDGYGNTNFQQQSDSYNAVNSYSQSTDGCYNTNSQTQQADGYNDTKSYKANNSCENCSQSNNLPLSPIIPLAPDEILLPLCKYLCN